LNWLVDAVKVERNKGKMQKIKFIIWFRDLNLILIIDFQPIEQMFLTQKAFRKN
jgi:hypothetical protein